jgi:4-hydroxybenzoate polyprenyltransferase
MWARFILIRPLNLLIIAAGQIAIFHKLFLPSEISIFQLFIIVFSTTLTAAGGYVINDYFDIETDRINKPKRPYANGRINRADMLVFYFTLVFSSILLSYFYNFYFNYSFWFSAVLFCNALLYFYAHKFKKFPVAGNLIVSLLVAFLFGSFNMFLNEKSNVIYELSVMAFLATFIRENFKNIEDVEGDKHANRLTLPIVIGCKNAYFATGFISILSGIAFVIYSLANISQLDTKWFGMILMGGFFYLILGFFVIIKKEFVFSSKASLLTKIQMSTIILSLFFL